MPPSNPSASNLAATSCHVSIGGHDLYTLTLTPPNRMTGANPWLISLHEGLGCTAIWQFILNERGSITPAAADSDYLC